jgi:tellurite resistance protein TerC
VLGFVGIKMIVADSFHIPNWASLAVIVTVLGVTIYASMRATRKKLPEEIEKATERKRPLPK